MTAGATFVGLRTELLQVLIVEDEFIIAHAFAQHLRAAGFAIAGICSSVDSALEMIASTPVDAAILDFNLQYEIVTPVAEALAAKQIPFLICSGSVSLSLGGMLYPLTKLLQKPVAPELMVSEFTKIVSLREV